MYDLKIDPKLPYHYLISVGVRDMRSEYRGAMYLKHGPLFFTNDHIEKIQEALMLSKDRLFPTHINKAMDIYGVRDLTSSIHALLIAARVNTCSVHHFSSDVLIEEDYWEMFVELANKNEHERRRLLSATINSRGFI